MLEPQVRQLVERVLDTGCAPEEVCHGDPVLLEQVRTRLRRAQRLEQELELLFPTPVAAAERERGRSLDVDGVRTTLPLPRIPGYEVQGVLGYGGVGVVYRVRHLGLQRPVALKMLLAGEFAGPVEVQRFLREASAVAQLHHPHVVAVHDVGEHEGRPYFTMELLEGGTLATRLAGRPQPPREAAALISTLADAVEAAHRAGIVHRDLKPANILLTADGVPKVADFGLARGIDEGPGLTRTGSRLGTPSYMAPEQARGDGAARGPACDVHALGAMLYEVLTGRPPFRADTAAETERQVIAQDPLPPSRLEAAVPRDLETICLTCLRKDPHRRYASAALLAADLRRFLAGEPVSARPLGLLARLGRRVRRNPLATALTLTALALVALAAGFGVREWSLAGQRRLEEERWVERLAFVQRLEHEGRFAEARAILLRLPDAGSESLRARIRSAQDELDVLERLDLVRFDRAAATGIDFDDAATDARYAHVFADAGLGQPGDSIDEVASRVRAADSRLALVAALDDWAFSCRDRGRLSWILGVARRADPDPWRDRVRTPTLWTDGDALEQLAADADPASQSVALQLVLAGRLRAAGRDHVGWLRRGPAAHPDDYWVDFVLAEALGVSEESVGFYRVALALRPHAVPTYVNLGNVLAQLGRVEEARGYWTQALALEPRAPLIHQNLAVAALNVGELEAAVASAHDALALDPTLPNAQAVLGMALLRQGRPGEAVAPLRSARELMRPDDPQHAYVVSQLAFCEQVEVRLARARELLEQRGAPAAAGERLLLARDTLVAHRPLESAALYAAAFEEDPAVADDLHGGHRYNAACAALRLAGGVGGAPQLPDVEQASWRRQGLAWLAADLAAWTAAWKSLHAAPAGAAAAESLRDELHTTLGHWQRDGDLAPLREVAALASLPESERRECETLWHDVQALLDATAG